jgi:hypothetical protein
LAAVGVESRPATHELWARSRQVARALNDQEKRQIYPTAPAFAPRSKLCLDLDRSVPINEHLVIHFWIVGDAEVTSYENPIGNGKFAHSELSTT